MSINGLIVCIHNMTSRLKNRRQHLAFKRNPSRVPFVCRPPAIFVFVALAIMASSCGLSETSIVKRFQEPGSSTDVVLVFFGQSVVGEDSYKVAVVRHNRNPSESNYIFETSGVIDPEDITLRWYGEPHHLVITIPPTAQVSKQEEEIQIDDELVSIEYKAIQEEEPTETKR